MTNIIKGIINKLLCLGFYIWIFDQVEAIHHKAAQIETGA